MCSLGYCTVIDKDTFESYDTYGKEIKNVSEMIIRYTLSEDEKGRKNLFVPYYDINGASETIKNELVDTILSTEYVAKKDPYFNTDIIDLCLE